MPDVTRPLRIHVSKHHRRNAEDSLGSTKLIKTDGQTFTLFLKKEEILT
jgi:hypothetical protein